MVKKSELRGMSLEELNNKLKDLRKGLMKENAQVAIGTIPKSPGQFKVNKKTVARILSIIKEKEVSEKENLTGMSKKTEEEKK